MKITAQVKTHVMNSNFSYIRYNGFYTPRSEGCNGLKKNYNLVYLLNNVIANKTVGKYWVSPSTSLLFC